MPEPSDYDRSWEERREQIIGLGERSARKSYYPELQQRLRELKEQQYYLEKAQELGQIGTWDYNFRRNRFVLTKEACRIIGLPGGSEPSYRQFLKIVHPEDRRVLTESYKAVLLGTPYDHEYRIVVDGRIKWVKEKAELERDHEGVALRSVGFIQEITERKQREEELRQKNAELDAINAELERFTYTVSHDLKSPLITIQGFAAMVEDGLRDHPDPALKSDLAQIRAAAARMYALLNDLLELSRVGHTINPVEEVDLTATACEAIELLRGALARRPANLRFTTPLPRVTGDRDRLREVFQNLIENAVKYMGDQPAPLIEIGIAEHAGRRACFVRDNGQGVAPEHHESVFLLFNRLHQNDDGTGIGLALVKHIIELHRGRVWLESAGAGQGTTIWFTLPWRESAPPLLPGAG